MTEEERLQRARRRVLAYARKSLKKEAKQKLEAQEAARAKELRYTEPPMTARANPGF